MADTELDIDLANFDPTSREEVQRLRMAYAHLRSHLANADKVLVDREALREHLDEQDRSWDTPALAKLRGAMDELP